MSKWIGSWLSGPRSVLDPDTSPAERSGQKWRGERLGLPESGPDSVSSTGRRAVAMLVDCVLASLVAFLFTRPELPMNWSLLSWYAIGVISVSFFGATPGMVTLGIRVARLDGQPMVGLPRAMLRTALVFVIIPAVVWDVDNRGLHDRLTGTVVVRSR